VLLEIDGDKPVLVCAINGVLDRNFMVRTGLTSILPKQLDKQACVWFQLNGFKHSFRGFLVASDHSNQFLCFVSHVMSSALVDTLLYVATHQRTE
jgi:hypothetical protein